MTRESMRQRVFEYIEIDFNKTRRIFHLVILAMICNSLLILFLFSKTKVIGDDVPE